MNHIYKKRVAFHETDCMGVAHHSSYVKYFEEARVDFIYAYNLEQHHAPYSDYILAVLDLKLKYNKPLRVGDFFEVHLKVSREKATRLKFEYLLYLDGELMTSGESLHIGVDSNLKVLKIPEALKEGVERLNNG